MQCVDAQTCPFAYTYTHQTNKQTVITTSNEPINFNYNFKETNKNVGFVTADTYIFFNRIKRLRIDYYYYY